MEKKEPIRVSMSAFFLVIAIIVIAVMGYFMYKMYNEKSITEKKNAELNAKISSLENTINNVQSVVQSTVDINTINKATTEKQETTKEYSYKDIKGLYKLTKKVRETDSIRDIECTLCLYENGTFIYHHAAIVGQSLFGNYVIDNDVIILNLLFRSGNDVGITTTSGQLKLKINTDNSITDNNNSFGVDETKNMILYKTSENEEQEYLKENPSIMDKVNTCIGLNVIFKGE